MARKATYLCCASVTVADNNTILDNLIALCPKPESVAIGIENGQDRRKIAGRIKSLGVSSRRYLVDEETTAAASRLGVSHPEILGQVLRRARAPFDKIWLEWSLRTQLTAVGAPVYPDAPERCGVFVEKVHPTRPLYRMTEAGVYSIDSNRYGYLSPVSILFDCDDANAVPGDDDHLIATAVLNSMRLRGVQTSDGKNVPSSVMTPAFAQNLIDTTYLASAYQEQLDDPLDDQERIQRNLQCTAVSRHAKWSFTPVVSDTLPAVLKGPNTKYRRDIEGLIQERITECSGMWRFVISLLYLLNEREYVESDETWRAGKARFTGGGFVPYLEFRRTRIKLPPPIVIARGTRALAEGLPRRRHEVSGHWCVSHTRGDPSCDHVYVNETDARQTCPLCGHKRWWRNNHERGDASLGYVLKERVVTTRET